MTRLWLTVTGVVLLLPLAGCSDESARSARAAPRTTTAVSSLSSTPPTTTSSSAGPSHTAALKPITVDALVEGLAPLYTIDELKLGPEKATELATFVCDVAPMTTEIEQLGELVKMMFRDHPIAAVRLLLAHGCPQHL